MIDRGRRRNSDLLTPRFFRCWLCESKGILCMPTSFRSRLSITIGSLRGALQSLTSAKRQSIGSVAFNTVVIAVSKRYRRLIATAKVSSEDCAFVCFTVPKDNSLGPRCYDQSLIQELDRCAAAVRVIEAGAASQEF